MQERNCDGAETQGETGERGNEIGVAESKRKWRDGVTNRLIKREAGHYHCLVWICVSPATSVRHRDAGDEKIIVSLCNVPWGAGTETEEKKKHTGST